MHEGYDLMQRFTPEDNSLARELFSKAASIDPEFAAAYAAIGGTYRIEGQVGWTPTPRMGPGLGDERAVQAHVQKAIQVFPMRSRFGDNPNNLPVK